LKLEITALSLAVSLAALSEPASADCRCVSIAADVPATGRDLAIRADNLYAAGDLEAAARLYAAGYAETRDAVFLYAEAQCQAALGDAARARALFQGYVDAGGALKYGTHARSALASLGGRIKGATGAVGGLAGAGVGVAGGVADTAGAGAGAAVGAGGDLSGTLTKKAEPPRVAKGAAILLGVVAVAAIGAVGIQGIAAGVKDDIEFDKKFGVGMGLSGAVVGGTAIYLYGLTAATGAAAGAGCLTDNTIITPVAHRGGAGAALATRF
jgi:hypothetical protein